MTIALAVVSGVLFGLAFPPSSAWPIAWIALVPLLVGVRRAPLGRVLLAGWLWTMALSVTVISWFGVGAADYFHQSRLFGLALFLVVPTVTGAIEYAGFAACYRAFDAATPLGRVLLAAAAWVVAELARTTLFYGNPWGLVPYTQLDVGSLAQIADTTGIYGVSFAVGLVNAAVAEVVRARLDDRRAAGAAWRTVGVALVLVAAVEGWGRWRAHVACGDPGGASSGVVAAVQGDVDIGTQWHDDDYGKNLDTYLALTTEAAEQSHAALVLWPENTMTFFLEPGTPEAHAIAHALAPTGTELVAGGPTRRTAGGRDGFFNSAHLMRADGTLAGRYDKQYLIPFGERLPLRTDLLLALFARDREFAPGEPSPPLPSHVGPLGILICNEALFPGPARDHVRRGAQWLAILANDGWTTSPQYGETALLYARMRAIELRRWVVRSSTSGPSALVDPCGAVVARTAPFTQAVLAGTIVPRADRTPYAVAGDVLPWSCVIGLVAWAIGRRRDRSFVRVRAE